MSTLNKKSLHAVVDHLLRQGGERPAIELGTTQLSYAELDQRSRWLAWRLKALGAAPGVVVAIALPASIDYVVALFATLRAGAIALAVDPTYPPARLEQLFALAAPRLLVLGADEASQHAARLAEHSPTAIEIVTLADLPSPLPAQDLPPICAADDDTGYLIHTSGSTGTPKLIAGRSKGVSHFVHWEINELGIDEHVRASFFAPPTFDVSLREIFVPLLAGGTLVVPEPDDRQDADRLARWLHERRITLMHAVPSLFRLITRALRDSGLGGPPTLRLACLAGEPLYGADVAAWRAAAGDHTELINLYGPSETTLAKAFHRVDRETYAPGAIVPIGQPIANAALLVLRQQRLADIGEIGEIHIRTPFASNGYWQDAALTANAFIANPLSDQPDDLIYRTGDLGRYRPDRSIEFVGRADRQVKIDGVRIELPEIEGALRAHPGIGEAAAHVFRLADGGAQLVGYYTDAGAGAAATTLDSASVRTHLASLLPAAMIPGHLMALPSLPKNLNGKIDRKALPRPDALLETEHAYVPPRNDVETQLAQWWADTLGLTRVGVDSPWLSVGGSSLKAIGLIGRINQHYGAALTIRDFLGQGTVRSLAAVIAQRRAGERPPLQAAEAADSYPLTDGQRRLWILSRLDDAQCLYNNVEWLELRGPLNLAALRHAFQTLVDRHESLRTVFFAAEHDGEPRQRIVPAPVLAQPLIELPAGAAARDALAAALAAESDTAFDLAHGPLIRVSVLREGTAHHHVLVTLHHIVCDGWSMAQLTRELCETYRHALAGQPLDLPLPAFRPRDVAVWLAQQADSPLFERCRDYWRGLLVDADERARLAPDAEPEPRGSPRLDDTAARHRAARQPVALSDTAVAALHRLLGERHATPFAAIAATLAVALYRHGGRERIIIGLPVAGRDHPGLDTVVGFCVNTLPLVLRLDPAQSFAALLEQASRAVAAVHAHAALPFDQVLAELAHDHGDVRDPLANPLFDVFLAAEPAGRPLDLPGLDVVEHEPPNPAARYDLSLRFIEGAPNDTAAWRLVLEYRQSLWRPDTMRQLARHLAILLEGLASAPDQPIATIPMLAADELAQLAAWSHGPCRPLGHETLATRFARQAERTPAAIALLDATVAGDPAPTRYDMLHRRAETVAKTLRHHHAVRPGDVVGLLLPRGSDWVAALLGIIASGAVALPLDPRHPAARLSNVLADAGARVLITHADTPADAMPAGLPRLDPGSLPATPTASLPTRPHDTATAPAPDDPAYLIYTSGSTGTPKGVLVSHRAFLNMIDDQIDTLRPAAGDRVLQFVSPAFDVALFEVYFALLSGAALAIPHREQAEDATRYAACVAHLGATMVMLTPGFLNTLDTLPAGIRMVISGGEPPIHADVRRCLAAGIRYINAYGPTETAVNAALYELHEHPANGPAADAPIPLGRAIANGALQVVAPDLTPLPAGVAGELLISGASIALGYLNRPALTERAFGTLADGTRYYRSGDLARRQPDGSLVYLGRRDGQLKVRGHRIETGEVEAAIQSLTGLAVRVIGRARRGENELLAYWIGTADRPESDSGALRARLATHLPDYAIPSHFIRLARFPLTGNGKLDPSRLPAPHDRHSAATTSGAAASGTAADPREPALLALWRNVLDLPDEVALDRDSDFFSLGGRSLAANRLALGAARALGREVTLRDLYAAPTPAALLHRLDAQPVPASTGDAALDGGASSAPSVLPTLPPEQPAPLSPMQRRLWVIDQLGESGGVYHIAGLTRLDGTLDLDALRAALTDLATRQAVLRSRIVADGNGDPLQVLDPAGPPPLTVHAEDDETHVAAAAATLAAHPFDLATEWPLRVHVWPLRGTTPRWHVLVILHHLAGDGWSMPILTRELAQAYNARHAGQAPDWPALPAQYRDVAAWLHQRLHDGAPDHPDTNPGTHPDARYWHTVLAGELPLLALPTDLPRPPVRGYRGATHAQPLPATALAALQALATPHRATPFAVFVAAVQTLLARLSAQQDIIVGVPLAGRAHPASEGLIGFFVNTLPLRAQFTPDTAFAAQLHATAAQLRLAQQHQAYPFDRLVEDLDLPHDPSRSPVFDVLVSLDEDGGTSATLDGLHAEPQALARSGSRCDLWWMLDLTGTTPTLRVEYDTDLFLADTVARWSAHLLHLIASAQAAPATPATRLGWLSADEAAALRTQAAPDWPPLPDDTVLDRFEAWAARQPDAIALADDQRPWHYGELDHAANALAHRIVALLAAQTPPPAPGNTPLVALMLERGATMAVALLACLKAGCAYLPIEPDSPAARAASLLDDAGAAALLLSPQVPAPAGHPGLPTLRLDADPAALLGDAAGASPPGRAPGADDIIYVMYTSGSTGRPKGVVITHRAVTRLVLPPRRPGDRSPDAAAAWNYYHPQHGDRLLQLSNYAFDGATFDFYAALANGLTLCLPDRETVLDTARLAHFIERHRVNVGFMTTALLNKLVDDAPAALASFRRLYFGGQEASLPHVRRALAQLAHGALVHVYGPTEVTTFSSWHPVEPHDLRDSAARLAIGRPIAHTEAYIVDAVGQLQPTGVPGELWLGGAGVARGYLGRTDLTDERFVASPFARADTADVRLFRTGDLCVRRADGAIEFLGRLDGQVKIRGYRIELGEIEAHLAAAPGVAKVHVLARPAAGGNHELVAYLTARDGELLSRRALVAELAHHLPPYMFPAHFVVLPQLPLNANGKVDRHALPTPESAPAGLLVDTDATLAPRSAAERALHQAWSRTLQRAGSDNAPTIGLRDNYFALGGDSIQALQIVARLREAGWTLKVTDLLRHPTIETLAPLLCPLQVAGSTPGNLASVADDGRPPLFTPAQRWFLGCGFATPQHFNQSMLLVLPRDVDNASLQRAIATLWRHHDALRLTFGARTRPDIAAGPADTPIDGDVPWQRLLPADTPPTLDTVDCADADALLRDAQARQQGWTTEHGPLFAAVRYRLPDAPHRPTGDRLFLLAHHWIVDGVSWRILLDDLAALLAGRPTAPTGTSLSAWTHALAATRAYDTQLPWWREQAGTPAATLPLAVGADRARTAPAPLAERVCHAFTVSATATAALSASGHTAYQTQGDELLLAAWALALRRALAVADDAPGTLRLTLESHGRAGPLDGADLSRTVGWFTALFPLRLALSSSAPATLIREVKEAVRAVPDRGTGYGVLRWIDGDAALATAAAASPSEIGFNYLGRFDQDAALAVAPEATGDELAGDTALPHGIDVTAEIRGDHLHVRIVADTARHPASWCAQLAGHYAAALEEIAAHVLAPDAGALSPSDVDLDGIGLDELDAILDGLGQT